MRARSEPLRFIQVHAFKKERSERAGRGGAGVPGSTQGCAEQVARRGSGLSSGPLQGRSPAPLGRRIPKAAGGHPGFRADLLGKGGDGSKRCVPCLFPSFPPGGLAGSRAGRPGRREDRSISARPPCGRNFGPAPRQHTSACVRARARARAPGCVPARTGHGVHVLPGTTLPGCLQLGEFSFKPAPLPGHPPRPTGGDDVRSLVARQSPGRRRRSLTGAGAQTSAAGPLARLLGRRRLPPPHLPARPCGGTGGGGQRNRTQGEGAGGADVGVGVPICPLCPGAGEHINSAVSSQTRAPRARPRGAPRLPVSLGVAPSAGRGGSGQTRLGCFPFTDSFSGRPLRPGVAVNGRVPARGDHQVLGDVARAGAILPRGHPRPRLGEGGSSLRDHL